MQEDPLKVADGTELYGEAFLVSNARSSILLVHGYAEHCGRYRHVANMLKKWGHNVFTYDHRGHGKSPGLQAYIPDINLLVDDLAEAVMRVKGRAGHKQVFIVAHSMGSGIVLKAALSKGLPVNGYVFSGPVLKISEDISPFLQKIAPFFGNILPKVPLGDAGGGSNLSRDPKVEEAFKADPLCYKGRVRAKTGAEILALSSWCQKNMQRFSDPVLIMHGEADQLSDIQGTHQFMEAASSKDKTFIPFPGMEHEIFNELDNDEVFNSLDRWFNAHLD